MKTLTSYVVAVILFVASEAALAFLGLVRIDLILFIPVFVTSSPLALAPLLFFLLPVIVTLRSAETVDTSTWTRVDQPSTPPDQRKQETKIGGFVMIGPIPVIFGKGISGRVLVVISLIMLILIIAWLILSK